MSVNSMVLIGNLVDAPEVQVTAGGTVRTRFRLASTERRRDALTDTWQDGDSVFLQVTCWRRLAEHVGNSLQKGDRVIVCGRLRQWVAERDGVRRTMHELDADAIGPDLQRGMVRISRARRAATAAADADADADADAPGDPTPAAGGEAEQAEPAEPEPAQTEPAQTWLPPLAEVG